jgi:hypothetical protein
MSFLLTALTVVSIAVCDLGSPMIKEDLNVKKNVNNSKNYKIIYKKVPTKWIKIAKKSN